MISALLDLDCEAVVGIHKEEQPSRPKQQEKDHLWWCIACGVWDWLHRHVQDE